MKKGLLNTIKKKQLSFVEPTTGGKLILRGPVFAIDRPPAHMSFVESAPHNQLICPCRKKKGFF